ncbi:hypothetical protein KPA97_49450, partial [Burkholderia cenocepacia]|nr:hypothetical protein [Burkholderia cenocepacia]MDR5668055.1 hypothetical protein [Burkholderia cenocepacia]
CGTRIKGLSGDFIRHEPMAWAAMTNGPRVWEERPLPIAVFMPGSVARENAIRSLERAKVPYRTSYESPSLLGLLSMVEAGLAVAPLARCAIPAQLSMLGRSHGLPDLPPLELILVAPLARCAIPAQLSMLGRSHGLPDLPPLELILARSTKSKRPPCDFLAEQLMEDLQRQTGQTGDA